MGVLRPNQGGGGADVKSKTRGGGVGTLPPVFFDPLNIWEMGWFSVLSVVCFVAA